jgi:hypothetical protein
MIFQHWFYTKDAAAALDLPTEKLRELWRSGIFKMGFHVRDVAPHGAKRSTLQFHVDRCEIVLNTPPEKRKCHS